MNQPTLFLPLNYCVHCGDAAAPQVYQCQRCYVDELSLPTEYQSDHPYYCVYCKNRLDRYNDFNLDGSFKSDHYFCQGCDFVATTRHYDRRGYNERSIVYLEKALGNHLLPLHIRQAYERQHTAFVEGHGIYMEEPLALAPLD
jgi:hypothetical protein